MNFIPRWYQSESVSSVINYYVEGGRGNPLVGLPTGTGKSLVIALLNQTILTQWPGQRILNLTHVKELIKQNADKLRAIWPTAPMGIYSAGLDMRQTRHPIIYGGIQSVIKCEDILNSWWDLVLVDEAQLISPKAATMYRILEAKLKKINPNLKFVGFSATLFRMGQGGLTDEGLFTDVCYNLTSVNGFNRLIQEGWLSPPIPKRTRTELDVTGVKLGADGDYAKGALEAAVDHIDVNEAICAEMCENSYGRWSWMIFCAGIDHAEHMAQIMNDKFKVPTAAIHSRSKDIDELFAKFKRRELRCITGMNKFTTGFDHPPVDLIGCARPTQSSVLWVQMLGRGTRPYDWNDKTQYIPGFEFTKQNCMCLDFAGNTKRLGPINDPKKPPRPGGGGGGSGAPVKECAKCHTYNPTSVRVCVFCGEDFLVTPAIVPEASTEELVRGSPAITETFKVERVIINKHHKDGKIPSLRISYFCGGLNRFEEFVCLEHDGFAGKKAREWWRQRHNEEPPLTVDAALNRQAELKSPRRLKVWVNKEYPEITGYEF